MAKQVLQLRLAIDEDELLTAGEDVGRLLDEDDELLAPMRAVLNMLDEAITVAVQERHATSAPVVFLPDER